MHCRRAAYSTETLADNGSAMSGPPSSVEPPDEPSASPSQNDPEDYGIYDTDLIEEMKKYPILYKTAHQEHKERIPKMEAWVEICKPLFKNWNSYSVLKKQDTMKETQKRWMNLKEEFFMRLDEPRPVSPLPKKKKAIFDSMTFLLDPTPDQVEIEAYCPEEFAPNLDPVPQETPQGAINADPPLLMPHPAVYSSAMPSTSTEIDSQNPPEGNINVDIPTMMTDPPVHSLNMPSTEPDNPNMHFALMLVPLLNGLNSKQRYAAWPEILRVIQEAEGTQTLQILQHQLGYPPGMAPPPPTPPNQEPAQEAAVEEELYPSSHGRPRNPEGEIMYPETDNEDEEE